MVVDAKQLEQYQNIMTNNTADFPHKMDYQKMGRTIKRALLKAKAEARLIVGLSAAIKVLSKAPEGSLFCVMAAATNDDAATHMHEVLLEAFCYENDIYVIKVDCPQKLSRLLGKTSLETCCLIQKIWTNNVNNDEEQLSKVENSLVDYCEAFWDTSTQTIVQLPNV